MIRGLQGVTLLLDRAQKTAAILTNVFGFQEVARDGSVIRFAAAGDAKGSVVDIHETAGVLRGHQGRSSAHHIAFRAASDVQQAEMGREAHPYPRPTPDQTKGPKILREPGGVFVRDRDRYSRICGRRAGRFPWSGLGVAKLSRAALQGDRGACCPFSKRRRSDEFACRFVRAKREGSASDRDASLWLKIPDRLGGDVIAT
jgi:hypothetical protein